MATYETVCALAVCARDTLPPGDCVCIRRPTFIFCSRCSFSQRGGRKHIKCKVHPEVVKPEDLEECPVCRSGVDGTEKGDTLHEYFVSICNGKTQAIF